MIFDQKCVFITGTDTGVGKSIFSAFLALYFLNQGKKVAISKPIQTGAKKDTDFLLILTGNKIPVFSTYSFSLPAAPLVAAKQEAREIDIEKIISDIRKLEHEFDYVIVEGIGGIAVPIRKDYLVSNLIKDLNYPIIIVARPTLGTINHTVLTIEFAKQKGLNILGYLISGYDEKTDDQVFPPEVGPPLAEKTAPQEITNITDVRCLLKLPFFKDINYESLKNYILLVASDEPSSSKTPRERANV